jgi:DNA end-binding protein Ku
MLHKKDLSRLKEVWYCAEEDKPIDRAEIVKGFEKSKGEYVVVEDQELKAIAPPTAHTMEILQFVKAEQVDPVFFESSYYVAPDEHGSKPYTLFMAALRQTGHDAIAKLTMHNREHVVVLRVSEGALLLHTLYYEAELNRASRPHPAMAKYTGKELELAKSLVQHLTAPFKPEQFHDTYRANVERLIKEKTKGQKITTVPQPRKPPALDLVEALKRSLAQGRAPHKRSGSRNGRSHKAA